MNFNALYAILSILVVGASLYLVVKPAARFKAPETKPPGPKPKRPE
jgi:hypothetical protein